VKNSGTEIVICGFMGAGKSTWGQRFAMKKELKFLDLDEMIENQEGISVKKIFERFGAPYFRKCEMNYCRNLAELKNVVIAVGGGTFESLENVLMFSADFAIIFLDTDFETCYLRIKDSNRPLVVDFTKEQLQELFRQRRKLFLEISDIVISS
jgi:shikimate kinase